MSLVTHSQSYEEMYKSFRIKVNFLDLLSFLHNIIQKNEAFSFTFGNLLLDLLDYKLEFILLRGLCANG